MPSAKALLRLRAHGMALCAALALAACGGGGSPVNGGNVTAPPTTIAPTTPPTTTPITPSTDSNALALVVDSGPASISGRVANLPYVSVTVCPPGSSSNCRTIDHVLVDTGSSGLRLLASALGSAATAALPQVASGIGSPYVQCATFISGYTWGSLRSADVTLGGMQAAAIPIQVISDPAYPNVPAACSATGASQGNVNDLGANGILGIGHFMQDCGLSCTTMAINAFYYACSSATNCNPSTVPLAQQVANPISRMPSDNNGSMIQFPAVASAGQASLSGQLVLGIGTRSNNAVGSAVAYGVSASNAFLSSTYSGRTYRRTAFDSGSNFYFFTDPALATCTAERTGSFYCPATTQTLSTVINGTNGASRTLSFRIANAIDVFSSTGSSPVLPDVGADLGYNDLFLYGLPFYYGRSVFTAISGAATPLGTGPFVAF